MKYLFLLLLIISLKLISTKRKNEEINCDSYKDCFTCSTCNDITLTECECMWVKNSCKSIPTKLQYTKEWWNKFNLCIDNNSTESQNKYCGYPNQKNENSKNTIITYPEIDSHYGKQFLYCKYEYNINRKENDYVILKIKMNNINEDNLPLIGITFEYENEFLYHLIYDIGTNSFNDLKLSKADIVYIHLFSFNDYSTNPIFIEFDLDKNKKKAIKTIYIILIILVILIFIIFIIIILIYLDKRNKSKEIKNENDMQKYRFNYLQNNRNIFTNDEESNENKCCICNEEFITNRTEICKIPCQHICHYDCLKDKIEQNYEIKCKVCHIDILQYIDNNKCIVKNNEDVVNENNNSELIDNNQIRKKKNININQENQNNNIKKSEIPSIFNSENKLNNFSNNKNIPIDSKNPFASNFGSLQN